MTIEKDFTYIYNTHAPKVHRLCLGYASGNNERAKEWLQETFIKVWNHRASFKGDASVETWIYRIAVNTCLSDLRKSKKHIPVNEGLLSNHLDDDNNNNEAQINQMYRCINQLTTQNKALILLELEEIPQATIAETTGLAHGTLRTRLSRIRKALLKCITNGK
ncbi:RNA polymerase sigma factor [Winogradskyella sp. DF17]|uniref:RNA polymerase sigma factor n=1 Tax=Winogradskyella pelagia TaxID=2819984 RepID=A0ABS3SXA0_9FLAO|nr:RNA polymerase sigma factor [Winogradskyella sp. DF17]MBO3115116.1 RNA polymerase sigma factor [Winogradskyella sp. DF17]